MKKILAFSVLIASAFLMMSLTSPAEDITIFVKKKYNKTIEKSFPISKKGEVAIINKYGTLDINTWNKNEVQIKVEIVVNATSESVAEDVFERISIEFDNSSDRVFAETVIESKEDYWWNFSKNLKSDFEINYEVYMPLSCSVNFDNKYGNINMMDLENDATIVVKYGNLTMGDLEGDLSLELGYGNGFIGAVNNMQTSVAYSKLRTDYVNEFSGETKYSGITINNAKKVVVETKYDNYNLGNVGEFINEGKYDNLLVDQVDNVLIETKYTDLKVGTLTRSLTGELNYGGIRIKDLKKGFDKLMVEASYAGISVTPEPGAGFTLEMNSKHVDIDLPKTKDYEEEKDGSVKNIRAGFNGGGKSMMLLELEYGFLKVN
jgi:hypothetical protein